MGSLVTYRQPLTADLAVGATVDVPYPSGYNQAALLGSLGGHVAISNNEVYAQGVGVAFTFNASTITIQNNSPIV